MLPAALKPYAWLAGAALWAGSLVAVGWWQYAAGSDDVAADWQAQENEELRAATARIEQLQAEATAKERAHGEALSAIDVRYQNELKNANDSHQRLVAELRAGSLRLRDQYATTGANCGGASGGTAATAGERDGEAGTDLSGPATGFLLDLTKEADDAVRQLSACQEVVIEDRKKKTPGS